MIKAAFLDRDGTIIEEDGYVHSVRDMMARNFRPGAIGWMRRLQKSGYELVVVTNQGGVGLGHLTPMMNAAVNYALMQRLMFWGVPVANVYACVHQPGANCACRKPEPGMIYTAAADFGIDIRQSLMIGDRQTDVDAGIAAGCRASLLLGPGGWPALDLSPYLAETETQQSAEHGHSHVNTDAGQEPNYLSDC
jgi:D-glycero-D-manno-heptose 1,7-bisphosphate phosphatase